MKHRPSVTAVLIVAGLAAFSLGPDRSLQAAPDTQARSAQPTQDDARKYLVGKWSLASFEVYPPGQLAVLVKGNGNMWYDEKGTLWMTITADPSSVPLLEKAGIVLQKSGDGKGVIKTEGRTIIDVAAKTLTYDLKGQPNAGAAAGPLAANRPRHYQVQGNLLTLTTKDDQGRPLSIATWRKEQ